jgi:hypothetical protein
LRLQLSVWTDRSIGVVLSVQSAHAFKRLQFCFCAIRSERPFGEAKVNNQHIDLKAIAAK